MALSEARTLEATHAILAFAAEQDTRSFDWAELELPALEGLADSTVAGVLDALVDEGQLEAIDANSWRLPEPELDETLPPLADGGHDYGDEPDEPIDGDPHVRGPELDGDDWVRLPEVGDGKAIAIIELDAALVSALARIHPAERAVIVTQIEASVRNVLRETRRLMPTRDAAGEFELVDYAELVVGAGREPA